VCKGKKLSNNDVLVKRSKDNPLVTNHYSNIVLYTLIFVGFHAHQEVLRQSFWWRMVCIDFKCYVLVYIFLGGCFLLRWLL